jgi:hypothetical protein
MRSVEPPLPNEPELQLVIDLADDSQLETAGDRINVHYEIGVAARLFEPARASNEVEHSLIDSRN